jgi:hypothetical protein
MGWVGNTIGRYRLICHDSTFDEFNDAKKPKEWFENKTVEFEFTIDKKEESIKFSLLRFGKLKKLKKNWCIDLDYWENKTITKLLFEELDKRGFTLMGQIYVGNYREDGAKYFYLQSNIGEDEIHLCSNNKGMSHVLSTFEEYMWLVKNHLEFQDGGL